MILADFVLLMLCARRAFADPNLEGDALAICEFGLPLNEDHFDFLAAEQDVTRQYVKLFRGESI